MKSKRPQIDQFFSAKKYAIAGVSRNEHKTGTAFYRELSKKGMDVVGVSPHMQELDGKPCFATVGDLPDDVESLILAVKPEQGIDIIKAAHSKGINNVWIQQGAQSDEMIKYAEDNNMNVIYKECVMMYSDPVTSIHKFHRGINKLFGKYHK